MSELSAVSLTSNVSSLSPGETNVYMILQNLNDISNSFVNIAFYLSEISRRLQYRDFGFDNIVDFSLAAFGFNKSMTYGLISIRDGFMNGDRLKDKYVGFSQSQLMEMSSIRFGSMIDRIAPSDTVASIRAYKKAYAYCDRKDYRAYNYTLRAKTVPEFLSLYDEYMSSAPLKGDNNVIECSSVDSVHSENSDDNSDVCEEGDSSRLENSDGSSVVGEESHLTCISDIPPIPSPSEIIKSTSCIKENGILPPLCHCYVCQWDTGIKFFRRYFDSLHTALQFASKVVLSEYSPHVFYVELRFLTEYNV